MPFINQHQVIALKTFGSHRLVTISFGKFIDINNLHIVKHGITAFILVEYHGVDTRQLKLLQVLLTQAFIRRKQDNLVNLFAYCLVIMLILQYIDMHNQRFTASCGVPIGDFVQVFC